jgi:hypothetical protein
MINPPNENNVYLPPVIQMPSCLEITAISQSNPMMITTSTNSDQVNTYLPGQNVKLVIPATWGMWQANQKTVQIVSVVSNDIYVSLNSTNFDPFSNPNDGSGPASLAPSGSMNLDFNNITSNKIAFRSYNNVGN